MRSYRSGLALLIGALVAAGCSSVSPEDLEARFAAPTTTIESGSIESDDAPTTTAPAVPESTTSTTVPDDSPPAELSDDLAGSIVIGGLSELLVTAPSGRPTASFPAAGVTITQPTWSRDGEGLIATAIGEPVTTIAVRDGAVTVRPARRPYFFYSWSGDGRYVAALGPGPAGTTLDILAPDGVPISDDSLDTASFYLAWEPGGDDLVIHRDDALELVRDPADLSDIEPLGDPGQSFLAPAWIPGTRSLLIVDEQSGEGRLVRLDVDTLETDDLGPVDGSIGISVSPDGSQAVLAHAVGPAGGDLAIGFVQNDVTAPTEIVDLATGERTPISDQLTMWTEWSPDGSKLALMQPSAELDGAVWAVWDGDSLVRFEPFRPTLTYFRNYVFFSWQFTESPRIWSPDSDAIVYAAQDDLFDGIWIRELDGSGPVRISDGDVAFWSVAD